MDCKICHTPSRSLFDATILSKHRVAYFVCPNCGFVQTEEPFWLNEAYAHPISTSDVGLVARNITYSRILRNLITLAFDPSASFLDYGAGYGILVRLMRDQGFDYRWYDKFTQNLFAQGLEHRPGKHYAILSAFEVFEHLPNPAEEMAAIAPMADTIIFSTELVTSPPPGPHDWYYYGLNNGQHVAIYTEKSLRLLGEQFHFHYIHLGGSLHMFSKIPRNRLWLRIAAFSRLSNLFLFGKQRSSLADSDGAASVAN